MANSIFSPLFFVPSGRSIFGLGSTYEELTENLVINIPNARVATTADLGGVFSNGIITLPGPAVIDGVALDIGDRVVVKDQANQIENGVYVVLENTAPGILGRAVDFQPMLRSSIIFVEEGLTNPQTLWYNVLDRLFIFNTDPVVFFLLNGAGGGGGTVTNGANVGGFAEVFQMLVGTILQFRTLQAGSGISITQNPDNLLIENTGILALANVGGFAEIFQGTVAGTANLRTLQAGSGITITQNPDNILIEAGGGGLTNAKIAFTILYQEAVANSPAYIIVSYFPWDNSAYGAYSGGELIFSAEVPDTRGLDIQLRGLSSGILTAIPTINASGLYTFPVVNPVGDDTLVLEIQNDSVAGTDPSVFGATLRFDSNIFIPSTPKIANTLLYQQVVVSSLVFIIASYFPWDNSQYSTYTTEEFIISAVVVDRLLEVQLRGLVSGPLAAVYNVPNGLSTFNFSKPVVDDTIIMEVRYSGAGATNPRILGASFRFDQN